MKTLKNMISFTICLLLLVSSMALSFNKTVSAKNSTPLLKSIVDSAKNGKVINCQFPVKTKTIDDVIKVWGEPDKIDYVAAAKGSYATFDKKNVVFGFNKGQQIFEVRDMDSASLKSIVFSDIQKYLGKPAYDSRDGVGRRIIGYKVSDLYKLEFVLYDNSSSARIHHYNVLYPQGTVNMMADDPGRQW